VARLRKVQTLSAGSPSTDVVASGDPCITNCPPAIRCRVTHRSILHIGGVPSRRAVPSDARRVPVRSPQENHMPDQQVTVQCPKGHTFTARISLRSGHVMEARSPQTTEIERS
jgi:hypothetical protein